MELEVLSGREPRMYFLVSITSGWGLPPARPLCSRQYELPFAPLLTSRASASRLRLRIRLAAVEERHVDQAFTLEIDADANAGIHFSGIADVLLPVEYSVTF
jgi:hypothetical protein